MNAAGLRDHLRDHATVESIPSRNGHAVWAATFADGTVVRFRDDDEHTLRITSTSLDDPAQYVADALEITVPELLAPSTNGAAPAYTREGSRAERRAEARTSAHQADAAEESSTGQVSTPLTADAAEAAVMEAVLDDLIRASDPWEYLDAIHVRFEVPPSQRNALLPQFFAMVSQRPLAEQDALINAGLRVFHYRTETARREVEQLRTEGADTTRLAPTVITDDFMAEIIAPDSSRVQYLLFRVVDGQEQTEIVDRLTVGTSIHMPPQTNLILPEIGCLVLPTGVEEYGTDADLFSDVRRYIDRHFCIVNPQWLNVATSYVLMSWVFDRFDSLPYLHALGDFGSGKSTLLQTVGHVAFRPIFGSGAATASPVFRLIHGFRGTLVLDEANFAKHSDVWAEISKILLCGYGKGAPVLRTEKTRDEGLSPSAYNVFGPKVIATRKRFDDDAIQSRCFTYSAPVLTADALGGRSLDFDDAARAEAAVLQNKLLLWRFRHYRTIGVPPDVANAGPELRVRQIIRPLLAVAEDGAVRRALLDLARESGSAVRADRGTSIEGDVVRAMSSLETEAAAPVEAAKPTAQSVRIPVRENTGWLVSRVAAQINMRRPERFHVSPKRVSSVMQTLLGYASTRTAQNTARFAYSADNLVRLRTVYGVAAPISSRTPVPLS